MMAETKKAMAKKPAVKKEPSAAEKWVVKALERIKAAKDKQAAAVVGYEAGYKAGLVAGKKAVLSK